jgi:hypothetical protein
VFQRLVSIVTAAISDKKNLIYITGLLLSLPQHHGFTSFESNVITSQYTDCILCQNFDAINISKKIDKMYVCKMALIWKLSTVRNLLIPTYVV